MPTHAPKKYLISHASLQHCFDKSRSGLEKLRESDPSVGADGKLTHPAD